jgi:hypothetical protein
VGCALLLVTAVGAVWFTLGAALPPHATATSKNAPSRIIVRAIWVFIFLLLSYENFGYR